MSKLTPQLTQGTWHVTYHFRKYPVKPVKSVSLKISRFQKYFSNELQDFKLVADPLRVASRVATIWPHDVLDWRQESSRVHDDVPFDFMLCSTQLWTYC